MKKSHAHHREEVEQEYMDLLLYNPKFREFDDILLNVSIEDTLRAWKFTTTLVTEAIGRTVQDLTLVQ